VSDTGWGTRYDTKWYVSKEQVKLKPPISHVSTFMWGNTHAGVRGCCRYDMVNVYLHLSTLSFLFGPAQTTRLTQDHASGQKRADETKTDATFILSCWQLVLLRVQHGRRCCWGLPSCPCHWRRRWRSDGCIVRVSWRGQSNASSCLVRLL